MSVLIKGMEMPKSRGQYTLHMYVHSDGTATVEGSYCQFEGEPFVAIPVPPHGRLIDADALMEIIKAHDYPLRAHFNSTDNGMFTIGIQQAVDDAPTIIPAEPLKEEKND